VILDTLSGRGSHPKEAPPARANRPDVSACGEEPEIRPIRNRYEYLDALRVRVAVFVEEQRGPLDEEPDAWDDSAHHFVVLVQGRIVGTARLYQPERGTGKIGRVALLPEYRGRRWGVRLLEELLASARGLGFREVILDAQVAALPLYQRFGFVPEGEQFDDAGIPHQRMRLSL
jgi:predicted GNAT family N-acyltransferase